MLYLFTLQIHSWLTSLDQQVYQFILIIHLKKIKVGFFFEIHFHFKIRSFQNSPCRQGERSPPCHCAMSSLPGCDLLMTGVPHCLGTCRPSVLGFELSGRAVLLSTQLCLLSLTSDFRGALLRWPVRVGSPWNDWHWTSNGCKLLFAGEMLLIRLGWWQSSFSFCFFFQVLTLFSLY